MRSPSPLSPTKSPSRSIPVARVLLWAGLLAFGGRGAVTPSSASHSYPLTAINQFAGAVTDWYARFDLGMARPQPGAFVADIKSRNASFLWLPTEDLNCGLSIIPDAPTVWNVVDSSGNLLSIPYCDNMADLSDLGVEVDGQRFIDAVPPYLWQRAAAANADGHATDGLWGRGHYGWYGWVDVDLDRNGLNDMTEPGKGKDWAVEHWGDGVDILLANFRREMGEEKILLINTGSIDTPGRSLANGYYLEYHTYPLDGTWEWSRNFWANVYADVRAPRIFLQQSYPPIRDEDPEAPELTKNHLRFMRWSLVNAMLQGFYYTFEHVDGKTPDHWWNNYFDEFDADLGQPVGEMQRISEAVWVRFFERGVCMINTRGLDRTVTDLDLQSFSQYDGPYYRFRGGQDLALHGAAAVNNGQPFDQALLRSYTFESRDSIYVAGDALILLDAPRAVVSDIIIDNVEQGTSPVSEPAELAGFIDGASSDATGYYTLRPGGVYAQPPYAVAPPGAHTAVFRPNIGVAGYYEIFEWHARLDTNGASAVRHVIHHRDASDVVMVDQRAGEGRWNPLGTFFLEAGTSASVTIEAAGASGSVVADAVLFRFLGETVPSSLFSDGFESGDTSAWSSVVD